MRKQKNVLIDNEIMVSAKDFCEKYKGMDFSIFVECALVYLVDQPIETIERVMKGGLLKYKAGKA